MEKTHKVIIVGCGETAEMAYEYFQYDSPYEIVGFSVEEKYIEKDNLFGLPVVPLERVESYYPTDEFMGFVAAGYGKLNRVRERLYEICKGKNYRLVSYISSKAFVWRNVVIGDNCFILENNTLQYNVVVGNNVTLWSGNHIGHRSSIGNHSFLSSHVVISGYCRVGEHTFFGVNSSVGDNVVVANDCVIGAGTVILEDTDEGKVYRGNPALPSPISSLRAFGVDKR